MSAPVWQEALLITGVVVILLTSWIIYWITSDSYHIMKVRCLHLGVYINIWKRAISQFIFFFISLSHLVLIV